MNRNEKYLDAVSTAPASTEELKLILSLIDLTSLEGTDNEKIIALLCEKAKKYGTAAVCIYPVFVSIAKKELGGANIKIASVAGAFPSGQSSLHLRLAEAAYALENGADEIDMVISRGKFLEGDEDFIHEEISSFKKQCGDKVLKVILETGELGSPENILKASRIAIEAGADFIKTSTGKIPAGATPEAVYVMLTAIKTSGKKTGIKVSGGIRDADAAVKYLRLAEKILGKEWLSPEHFRFGASRLADDVFFRLK